MVLLVTRAAVLFLALCLLTAYHNKYDLIKIQIWPCLPSLQYLKHVYSLYLLMGLKSEYLLGPSLLLVLALVVGI